MPLFVPKVNQRSRDRVVQPLKYYIVEVAQLINY